MKIEIWSDIACPYCFIGKRQLDKALSELPFVNDIEVIWRSFELDNSIAEVPNKSKYELLAGKYDQPLKWAELLCEQMVEQGKELGINFDFDSNKVTNTHTMHRLLKFAQQYGKANELKEAFFQHFFEAGAELWHQQKLVDIAIEVGLDAVLTQQVIDGSEYEQQVQFEQQEAKEIGISAVPFFIINDSIGMEGAQPVEHLKKMLTDVFQQKLAS